MENLSITNSIKNYGFIASIKPTEYSKASISAKNSTEDYVGKITALFLPYLKQNVSDGKIISLQNEIKKVVCEIRERSL